MPGAVGVGYLMVHRHRRRINSHSEDPAEHIHDSRIASSSLLNCMYHPPSPTLYDHEQPLQSIKTSSSAINSPCGDQRSRAFGSCSHAWHWDGPSTEFFCLKVSPLDLASYNLWTSWASCWREPELRRKVSMCGRIEIFLQSFHILLKLNKSIKRNELFNFSCLRLSPSLQRFLGAEISLGPWYTI